jgi:hypothetical protein
VADKRRRGDKLGWFARLARKYLSARSGLAVYACQHFRAVATIGGALTLGVGRGR